MNNKIILVNARFLTQKISGVQRFGIELSRLLKKHYPNIVFLAPNNILHQDLAKELNAVSFGSFSGHIWEQFELPAYIFKNYKHFLLLNFCNTAPLLVKNQIVTIHDVSYFVNKNWFSFTFRTLYRNLIPALAKRALAIITVSAFSREEIRRFIKLPSSKPIYVVYNAASEFFFTKPLVTKEKYILSVASLDPRKNLTNLIKAFSLIQDKYPGMKLILVGNSHNAFPKDMEFLVKNNNSERIDFTGYIDDMSLADLYKRASLFVYISFYEGFGIPPIEAISSGCPVLLSSIEVHREICSSLPFYCDPSDIKSIASKMEEALNITYSIDYLKHMQENVRKYSWNNSAAQVIEIIEKHLY